MPNARRLLEEDNRGLETAIQRVVEVAMSRAHTALPGIVDAYDAATQTANVTPQLQSRWSDEDGVLQSGDMPSIQGAPVYFPRAGGFSVTVPVTAGDPCLILFADRDISGYLEKGDRRVPPTGRMNAYNDAIVLPGLVPAPDAISPAPSTAGIEVRSDDGTTFVRVGPAGVELESSVLVKLVSQALMTLTATGALTVTSAGFAVSSTGAITLTRGANELLAVISAALGQIASSTAGGAPLSNAANITAEQVKIDAIRA